jgi:beta-glucosidase
MSDWGATHSTAPAANAGLEQDSGFPFDEKPYFGAPLKEAVAKGEVSKARLDEMATRILRSMFAHGLFDHPVTAAPVDLPTDMLAKHAEISRADAEDGMVLLKNDGAILPLRASAKKIVVIGGHADKGVLAGGGSSLVYPVGGNAVPGLKPDSWPGPVMYYPSAPLDAIRKQAPGATVTFVSGEDRAAAAAAAKDSDVAIVFATQWAGEAFDVSLTLADGQDALISAVAAANPKTVVVLETGGPVLTPWADKVPAILEAWYPGTVGGDAIANVLFGKVNPSGRLPVTFPKSLSQLPKPSEPNKGDTRYDEGATVGYKWFDAKGLEPQFAFGHGLSYSTAKYSGFKSWAEGGTIHGSFRLELGSGEQGKQVTQVYVSGTDWEAPKRLAWFDKSVLSNRLTNDTKFQIDPRLLATWDGKSHAWKIAGGTYKVMLATSSRDVVDTVEVKLAPRTIAVGWRNTAK